jgi:hypothetical protein
VQFAFAADGIIRSGDRVVGRISGACLLDATGGVLRFVSTQGAILGDEGERVGTFQPGAGRRDFRGHPVQGEVLVDPNGALGLTSAGDLYLASDAEAGLSLPAAVTGDGTRARRTALLLYSACSRFDVPGG